MSAREGGASGAGPWPALVWRARPLAGLAGRAWAWACVTCLALVLAACGAVPLAPQARHVAGPATGQARPPANPTRRAAGGRAGEAVPDFSHVFLIVLENLGAAQAERLPYVATLARRFATATDYYAVAHPSLPNYLALTSGRTWVTSDCWFCYVQASNLATSLTAAHISWGAYMQGLPGACWLGPLWPFGLYAGKHDPFRYYTDVRRSRALCARIQPLTVLTAALGAPGSASVPRFVWITPNLCTDGHDCPASFANGWLSSYVPRILASPAWRDGGVLFITWDESGGGDDRGCCAAGNAAGGGGGRVLTLVIARGLPAGLTVSRPYNHYALLRTIERAWGLPLLGRSAAPGVHAMGAFWPSRGMVSRR